MDNQLAVAEPSTVLQVVLEQRGAAVDTLSEQ
jgi:hypothetical protein